MTPIPLRERLQRARGRIGRGRRPRLRLAHVAAFNRNVGDNALNLAIEQRLLPHYDFDQIELVGNPFDEGMVERLDSYDAILFGGGGVIHSCSSNDSRKNREKTGTMWNMDLSSVRGLRPPMVLYGVGYNRFDGEPPPLPQMVRFFDILRDRGDLVAMRNDGSADRLAADLPALADRFRTIPDPGLFCRAGRDASADPFCLVQIASDRPSYRFPHGIDKFVQSINRLLEKVQIPSLLIPHTRSDAVLYERIANHLGVSSTIPLDIDFDHTTEIMQLYASAKFTISTRGHSQICSIGNGTPTFSLSTHPKVSGFMHEVGLGDACFDLKTESESQGQQKFAQFIVSLDDQRARIVKLNRRFASEIHSFNRDVDRFLRGAVK